MLTLNLLHEANAANVRGSARLAVKGIFEVRRRGLRRELLVAGPVVGVQVPGANRRALRQIANHLLGRVRAHPVACQAVGSAD